jgi:hypothetical protein
MFTSLLYSLPWYEGRVIVCSISVVLRLEILVDIPYLARSVVVARDITILLLPLYPTSR